MTTNKEFNEKVGARLANIRKKAGYTQSQLAKELETSQSLVSEYESGTKRLYPEVLFKLSKLFNVSTDEIIMGKKN